MWMQWFGVKLNFGHRGKIEAKTGGANWGGKTNNWGGICPPLPPRSAAAANEAVMRTLKTIICGWQPSTYFEQLGFCQVPLQIVCNRSCVIH